jgi:hypothetical protein
MADDDPELWQWRHQQARRHMEWFDELPRSLRLLLHEHAPYVEPELLTRICLLLRIGQKVRLNMDNGQQIVLEPD